MKREEKINRAKSLEEVVNLLSKSQIVKFAAVIAWYQVHNNFYYFLDERDAPRYLIDKCIGTKLSGTPINYRRNLILDHIETYKREEMLENLIELGKQTAKNKDIRTLGDLARNMRS